jgi:integrase
MSRGQGRVYRRGKVLWIDYGMGGQRHREPTNATTEKEAQRIMRERLGDREHGRIIARPERVFVAEYTKAEDGTKTLSGGLRWLHETELRRQGKKSLVRQQQCWNQIEKFFPVPTPVTALSPTRLDQYADKRLAEGAARQTVNNELSALRRGLNLAVEKKVLATLPFKIKLPKVNNEREGFFEQGNLAAVLLELPEYCRAVIRFLDTTGWRVREALRLTWDRIDWDRKGIRLSPRYTKGKKNRLFPFGAAPDLDAILQAAWKARNGPFVFQGLRAGSPLGYTTLLHHWQRATKRAGCPDRIIHDLRRTAVQAFTDAGVDEGTIMELCGMTTRSIFQRYLIVRQDRLNAAVAARFNPNGTVTAQSTLPQDSPSR